MAVEPTFHTSRDELLGLLRLPTTQVENISTTVDSQIQKARVLIYERLGATRTAALIAISYDENAIDTDGLDKLRARQLEEAIVRLNLIRVLPVLFLDASDDRRTIWNEDGFTRESPNNKLQALIEDLESEIDALFGVLEDSENARENTNGFFVSTITEDDEGNSAPLPYHTVTTDEDGEPLL